MEEDPDWWPNKTQEQREKPGPKRLRTEEKEVAIAATAMSIKEQGIEPSVERVRQDNPEACENPETGESFTDKYILEVFKARCHDPGGNKPWAQLYPLQKTALPEWLKEKRVAWGRPNWIMSVALVGIFAIASG